MVHTPVAIRALSGPGELPSSVVVINHSCSLEVLLRRPHMVFPELAEMPTVNHSITLIITQPWQ
jgi:hypothetical protein